MFRINKTSITYKWLKYFLVILILPLFLNAIASIYMIQNVNDELNEKNNILYTSIRREIDTSFAKYKKIMADLSINETIQFTSNIFTREAVSKEQEQKVMAVLSHYYVDLRVPFHYFVYFKSTDMLAQSASVSSSKDFFFDTYLDMKMTYDEWKDWLSSGEDDIKIVESRISRKDDVPKYIMIKYRLFENRKVEPTNFVIVLRDVSLINTISEIIDNNDIKFEIVNQNSTILASTFSSTVNTSSLHSKAVNNQGILITSLNRQSFIVNYIKSIQTKWTFFFYTSRNQYFAKIMKLILVILFSIILSVLIGITLITTIIDKQYSPIKKMLSQIPSSDNSQNEYLQLENAIISSSLEKKEILSMKEKISKSNFINLLKTVINGMFSDHNILQNNSIPKTIDLSNSANMLVLFSLKNYTQLFPHENISDYERFVLLTNIIENIGEELFSSKKYQTCFFELNGSYLCYINGKSIDPSVVQTCLTEITDNIEKYFNVVLLCACSKIYENIINLSFAYKEVLSAIEYIELTQNNNIIFYEDIESENNAIQVLTVYETNILINHIKALEIDNVVNFIDDKINEYIMTPALNPILFKYYVNDIINSIIREFSTYLKPNDSVIEEIYFGDSRSTKDVEVIKNNFRLLIDEICENISKENSSLELDSGIALIDKIKGFVAENYTNPNLCTEIIAQQCNLSAPYIARIFKKTDKIGIAAYITSVRLAKSKVLLTSTDMRIEDISDAVGFTNVNTFIRLFKKYEYMTPGNFRKRIN